MYKKYNYPFPLKLFYYTYKLTYNAIMCDIYYNLVLPLVPNVRAQNLNGFGP